MESSLFDQKRNSYMEIGEIYFWTATINKHQSLLKFDLFKDIIIQSLDHLCKKSKLDVFAFVIMPNHIHLIWRINENGIKESTKGSFLKFTAHEFKKKLKTSNPGLLTNYKIEALNKDYEFWKRDPLAIRLYTKEVAIQKLNYIHNNPLADHWNLAKDPCDYKYSSAKYYEQNEKDFDFLKDLLEEF